MGSVTTSFTTGRIEMFNGTTDGKEAYLDPSTNETNLVPKMVHHVTIQDIREQYPRPQLVNEGYEVTEFPSSLTEEQFLNNTTPEGKQFIRDHYWPEMKQLLQEKTGAPVIIPWHFSVRKQTLGYHPDEIFFMKTGISQPASTIHIDNSHQTAIDHLSREVGAEEAQRLIASHKRWAIVNVWRPVGYAVQRWPLLIVDYSRVKDFSFENNVARVQRSNDPKYYKSHDNFIKHHPDYIYRYPSNLRPEEVIMFKDYDSRTDKVRGCPHGGFQDDNTAEDAPARRSIEVRLFVFFDDE